MESSRRDLSNDMAEHSSILKNSQNAHFSLIFQDKPMFSHINGKLSPRAFKSLVPKESMVSDSVGTRPWYLAAPRKDHAISQPVLKQGFRRAVFVKRLFGDA